MLKFSVVTPNFNRADMLDACVQSVLSQNYPDFEHIVVDGGSTDGSLETLAKYAHLRLISGPDNGMYDALNKGVAASAGEIVVFLNTDDLLGEGAFHAAAPQFEDEEIFAAAGEALVFSVSGGEKKVLSRYSPLDSSLMECSTVGGNYFNAWFFRRSVFERVGVFDPNYRIAGDREFMFRFALAGLKYAVLRQATYHYLHHAGSLTFDDEIGKRKKSADEHLKMTSVYLRDPRVSREARRLLRLLRSRAALEMSIRYLKIRDFGNLFYYALRGVGSEPFWLFKFISHALRRGKTA